MRAAAVLLKTPLSLRIAIVWFLHANALRANAICRSRISRCVVVRRVTQLMRFRPLGYYITWATHDAAAIRCQVPQPLAVCVVYIAYSHTYITLPSRDLFGNGIYKCTLGRFAYIPSIIPRSHLYSMPIFSTGIM